MDLDSFIGSILGFDEPYEDPDEPTVFDMEPIDYDMVFPSMRLEERR